MSSGSCVVGQLVSVSAGALAIVYTFPGQMS